MPASPSRKDRRKNLQAVPEKETSAAVPERDWPEINFHVAPGATLSRPLGKIPPKTNKTVKVDGPFQAHLLGWKSVNHVDWQEATIALWRVLLREDYETRQAAEVETRRTGLPGLVEPGPLTQMLAEELKRMDEEQAELDDDSEF